ncbi:unannotated protein [freshwater metagenome]|uniref:Unannotated protein n=1 Tax=freshwater metagenome TaxID=449393 RepID=A0A6J6LMY1_9ZZZZ
MNPTTIPTRRFLCQTDLSPPRDAKMVDQMGTVATRSPASPEEISVSALVIKYQGPTISVTA